ncbi:sphingomyelin phosphodiesterase [Marasmius fiardii PR-910]|nr:sphingomyelin phosphodiesterase [Marasmius fiardii PR-910]
MRLSPLSLLLVLGSNTYLANASLIDDIINALEQALTCGGCHALLVPLKGLALLGDTAFGEGFTTVCTTLKVFLQDPDVCRGVVIDGPGVILAKGLRSIDVLGQTATKLCNGILGACASPSINQYTVPFPKAVPTDPQKFTSKGNAPFQVVHFSDVHIDRQYTVGSEANCTKPICCRNFADHTGPVQIAAEPNGNRKCDSPTSLAQSLLDAINANNKFSIFTGDLVEAAVWSVTKEEVTNDIEAFNDQMGNTLKAPVFPAVGNHEAAPVNSFARNTTTDHVQDVQFVFDTASTGWERWIGSIAADQVKHLSGSYSRVVTGTNLMIISLNTVYWYKLNFWLYDSNQQQPDPNGILGFLVSQLQAAEDAGQRAWIIGHMPPGIPDTFDDQSNYYDQVVQRYKNTIAGQFFGHTHQDEFEVAYSDYQKRTKDTATGVAWIGPALTPRSGNPAFKVYDIDPDTYEVMDARVYSADLDDPDFQTKPNWRLIYSARATYGPLLSSPIDATDSLGPSFWHQVTEGFERNDEAFRTYQRFKRRVGEGDCVDESQGDDSAYQACKKVAICSLRAARSQDNCVVPTPGLHLNRRETEVAVGSAAKGNVVGVQDRECAGTGLGQVLQQLSLMAASGKVSDIRFCSAGPTI